MNAKVAKAINEQMNFEFYSAYLYMAMSSYFKTGNLNGFANWMEVQAKEEMTHGMKFYRLLHDSDREVFFKAVPEPKNKWENPLAVFQDAAKHEATVTKRISALIDMALTEKDHVTNVQVQWFINEQIEEEANVRNIIRQLQLIGSSMDGLIALDRELAQRVFVDPTAPAGGAQP